MWIVNHLNISAHSCSAAVWNAHIMFDALKWPFFSILFNWAGHFRFWSWIYISRSKWCLFLYVQTGSGMYCNIVKP